MKKMNNIEAYIRDILAECSRRPHARDGTLAVDIIRRIETLAQKARDELARPPYSGPARDGIEAQRGLNDVWPGDPYDAPPPQRGGS